MIDRERLFARLDLAVEAGAALLSAPAGYGKSTLVAAWSLRRPEPVAWIGLEPSDDDPRRFLGLLRAALTSHRRGAPQPARRASGPSGPIPAPERAVAPLLEARIGEPMTVVLDDLQVITSFEILAAITFLVEHAPVDLVVVLVTRVDPNLPLTRWLASGRLVEIRTDELAFRADEVRRFLDEGMSLPVSASGVRWLTERTEGWAAGLQLAALALPSDGEAEKVLRALDAPRRLIADYLATEVLARLAEEDQRFLLDVSVAPRLCGSLCDALVDGQEGAARLETLEARNLFLTPIDDARMWWRFHGLFRDLLLAELTRRRSIDHVAALRARAAAWFAEHDLPDEALELAARAGDWPRALDLLTVHAWPALHRSEAVTVARWFRLVPHEQLLSRPDLAFGVGIVFFLALEWQQLGELLAHLHEADRQPDDPRLVTLEACELLIQRDHRGALEHVDRVETDDHVVKPVADWVRSVCLGATAPAAEADAFFDGAVASAKAARNVAAAVASRAAQASCALARAQVVAAETWLDDARCLLDDHRARASPAAAHLHVAEAAVALERGDLDAAQAAVDASMARVAGGEIALLALTHEVARRVAVVAGDLDAAERHAVDFCAILQRTGRFGHRIARALGSATRYDAAFEGGSDPLAARVARRFGPPEDLSSLMPFDEPRDRYIRLAIRTELAAGMRDAAARRIAALRPFLDAGGWRLGAFELDLLEAELALQAGDEQRARRSARRGLEGALAADLPAIVLRAPKRARGLVVERLEASTAAAAGGAVGRLRRLLPASSAEHEAVLSERELEVLGRVAEGDTNREAAEHLVVSPYTVKKHLENIYVKLQVGRRTAAVRRARRLGLI